MNTDTKFFLSCLFLVLISYSAYAETPPQNQIRVKTITTNIDSYFNVHQSVPVDCRSLLNNQRNFCPFGIDGVLIGKCIDRGDGVKVGVDLHCKIAEVPCVVNQELTIGENNYQEGTVLFILSSWFEESKPKSCYEA